MSLGNLKTLIYTLRWNLLVLPLTDKYREADL